MVLLTFTVYADVTALSTISTAYIGISVDEPLDENFPLTPGKVIGILNIILIGVATPFGPTTVNVNVGPGDHYVILGIKFAGIVIPAYRLQLKGAGTVVDKVFGLTDPKNYVYIAFNVDSNGNIKVISSGIIPPGGSPIVNTGSGNIIGTDITTAVSGMIGPLMESMMPLMLISMMVNMMMGMVTGIMGVFK
jgi:hypothetical protein